MGTIGLQEFIYDLSKAKTPPDAFGAWIANKDISPNYKLIIALEDYQKHVYPQGLATLLDANDLDFVAYFQRDNLCFLDDKLLKRMFENRNEDTPIELDYSIMLDTNYCSYISQFINSQKNNGRFKFEKESIYQTLDILLKDNYQYDSIFYFIENYDNLFHAENKVFSVSSPSHMKLYENLVNLEMFKSIDHQKYYKERIIKFNITEFEAKQSADSVIHDLYASVDSKAKFEMFLNFHSQIVLLLIGLLRIHYESKKSPLKKIVELFDYTHQTVGGYLEREMIVACKYLIQPKNVPVFQKINKGGKQTDLLIKIRNIAWDVMVPRVMEYLISHSKQYFMPLFISHDSNLKKLLKLFYIKGVLLDLRDNTLIPFPEVSSVDFYESEGINIPSYFFTEEGQHFRKNIYNKNVENQFEVINHEFAKLVRILLDT